MKNVCMYCVYIPTVCVYAVSVVHTHSQLSVFALFFHSRGSENPRSDLLNELGPADVGVPLGEMKHNSQVISNGIWHVT